MIQNILAVGAHPDDVEMGCGGAIVKHIEAGDNVYVLILTNGEKGKHSPCRDECVDSLKQIGVKEKNIIFGDFKDGFVKDDFNTINFIETVIKNNNIEKVFTHDSRDRHQDHRNTSLAVSAAARRVPEILLYAGPSTNTEFDPHYFVQLGDKEMQKKLEALKKYKTQIKKGIVDLGWIKNSAAVYGYKNNMHYAEAFSINHLVRGGKNV